MTNLQDLLATLVLGAYAFAGGSYVFGFLIYRWLNHSITRIRLLVTNHHVHRFEDIEARVATLERQHGRTTSTDHTE